MHQEIIAILIFVVVIGAIITEKVHRTAAALAGVVLLLLFGILDVNSAIGYVDFNTIGVLVGMMLFVAVIKHSGLFEYISIKAAKLSHGDPWKIMVAFIVITAVCSAFLDNVTTVLLMGPMTITLAKMLKIDPVPVLLGQILASNIGGTMTMIGDPPNIMIGSAAGLTFADFLENTGVACVIGLVAMIFAMKVLYKKHLNADAEAVQEIMELDEKKAIVDPRLMKEAIVMIVLIIIAFMVHDRFGIESCAVALTAAAIMMVIGKQDIEEVVMDVEWPTILFFFGLFIVVGGMVETGVIKQLATMIMDLSGGHPIVMMLILLWASAILSAILDNIPFVATLSLHDALPIYSADHCHGQAGNGYHAAVVGDFTGSLPGRKRHSDRRIGERGALRNSREKRLSDFLQRIYQSRIPDDDSHGIHRNDFPAGAFCDSVMKGECYV